MRDGARVRAARRSLRRAISAGSFDVDQHQDVEIAVADMADDRRDQPISAMSASVSATHSASREIGTQTSVDRPRAPGRSASDAQ